MKKTPPFSCKTEPTLEELRLYLQKSSRPIIKKDLVKVFNIKGSEPRKRFKQKLNILEKEGFFVKLSPPPLSPFVVTKKIKEDFYATELETPEKEYKVYINKRQNILKILEVGDRFFGSISQKNNNIVIFHESKEPLVGPEKTETSADIIGWVQKNQSGSYLLLSTQRSDKNIYTIDMEESIAFTACTYVKAERLSASQLQVRVIEILGTTEHIPFLVSQVHGLPTDFGIKALEEAQAFRESPTLEEGDVDLRSIPFVTIDGRDSKDFDDAIWAAPKFNQKGLLHCIVAIADVAYYVKPGSALDEEARKRGNSVYFPNHVYPMLPEHLSNTLCSLNPNKDRRCLAVHMWINDKGRLVDYKFERGIMVSQARLTYEDVETYLQAPCNEKPKTFSEKAIQTLEGAQKVFQVLRHARKVRQVLDLTLPETVINLNSKGHVEDITRRPALASHQLIEEFMILANVAAAQYIMDSPYPCFYRVHEPPSFEKIQGLQLLLKQFNLSYKGSLKRSKDFNALLQRFQDQPFAPYLNEMILRTQSQAVYTTKNLGHFGLQLEMYAHFTSPIRRYSDLIVHRSILTKLDKSHVGAHILPLQENFEELAQQISVLERKTMVAQREAEDRYIALYMQSQIDQIFEAYVTTIIRTALFVTIKGTTITGLLPIKNFKEDYYIYEDSPPRFIGRRTRRSIVYGQDLKVRLIEADIAKGRLLFDVVAPSSTFSKKRTKRRKR